MKTDFQLPKFEVKDAFGALSEVQGWGLKEGNIPDTWKVTKGEGVAIFIIDTGRSNHSDLAGAIVAGYNCTDEKDDLDYNGHSTAACSIIGAQHNDQGLVGIAPDAKIVCIKAMDSQGTGSIPSLYKALRFCLDEVISGGSKTGQVPAIINMSLGSPVPFPSFIESLIKDLYDKGVVIVCAAGNSGKIEYPAKYPWCISVGSYGQDGRVTNFSGKGSRLDFIAPGSEIYSCWTNDSYRIVKGTSFSSPYLSAIIALAISKHINQEKMTGKNDLNSVDSLRRHLIKYAKNFGPDGRDDESGYGSVDISKLINDPNDSENLPVLTPFVTESTKKKSWWKKLLGI